MIGPGTLAQRSAVVSDCGRRAINQDAVLVAALPDGGELVAVADGMGGHSAGEIASRLALEVVHAELAAGAGLEEAVLAANKAVIGEASRHAERHGMGTTLVALVRHGDEYHVANVGDSRAYRVDEQTLRQLTEDHSFVAEAVRSGQLSVADAEKSRWRNAVTRAVGTELELQVDCFGPFDATQPHTVVLCTDGLYRSVSPADLHEIVLRLPEPARLVQELANAALSGGADDNVSVAVITFGARPGGNGAQAPPLRPTIETAALAVPAPPAQSVPAPPAQTQTAAPLAQTPARPAKTPAPQVRAVPTPTAPAEPARAGDVVEPPAAHAWAVGAAAPRGAPPKPPVRRLKPPGRWTTVRLLIILAAVIVIIAYVLLLWLVL